MSRRLIDPGIPEHPTEGCRGAESAVRATETQPVRAIADLQRYYDNSAYQDVRKRSRQRSRPLEDIYDHTVFHDQEIDWNTYPNNLGHFDSPGCFRCHDGKHLDANQQAIRLECNVCHSIPVVAGAADFVTNIEISRGPEPESHRNPNWISLHNQAIDTSCAACHTHRGRGRDQQYLLLLEQRVPWQCVHLRRALMRPSCARSCSPNCRLRRPRPRPARLPRTRRTPRTWEASSRSTCAACHNTTTLAGGLDLTSYAAAMQGWQGRRRDHRREMRKAVCLSPCRRGSTSPISRQLSWISCDSGSKRGRLNDSAGNSRSRQLARDKKQEPIHLDRLLILRGSHRA